MDKTKKIGNIALKITAWLLVAFAVFMMIFTVVTVATVDRNDRSVFGIRFYIVESDSMSKSDKNTHLDVHFKKGDIVLVKEVADLTTLQAGDIISFTSMNNDDTYGKTLTHMIREVKTSSKGELIGFVTFGTHQDVNDQVVVEPYYVLGRYTGKLPGVGTFFKFVRSTPGYIVCILVPFLLLILYNGINVIRLFRKYRREQMEQMEAEREKIREEREENQRMLQELLALKEQVARQAGATLTDLQDPGDTQSAPESPSATDEEK